MLRGDALADPAAVLGVLLTCAAEQVLVEMARDLEERLSEFDPNIEHPVVLPRVPAKRIIKGTITFERPA
jgi:hypothetical protein